MVCVNGDVDDLEFIDDGLFIVWVVVSVVWEVWVVDFY